MKKRVARIMVASLLGLTFLTGCMGSSGVEEDKSKIDKLNVAFVPSREPEQIITATEPLKEMLKTELAKEGYTIGDVNITVGTSYEAVGEGLSSGTVDVGFIPGGTYVLYDDSVDVLLTSTRDGFNKDFDNPKDWNSVPTEYVDKQAVSYRSLFVAGPSEKGKELSAKINNGEKLTWEDLDSAKWGIMGPTSSAGYIYPTLYLKENYNKGVSDLSNKVQSDSYGSSIARLASEQIDVALIYADARIEYANKWTSDYGRESSIWEETNVIGLTAPIYNDTISVSKTSKIMTDEFKNAFSKAMINISKTEEGKKAVSIYSHKGYEPAKSSDYDNERKVQELFRELNAQ